MPNESIPPSTTVDRVCLTVANLDRSIQFYQNSLGFLLHRREGETAYLGAAKNEFLILIEHAGQPRNPKETGLYHFAILVPSRAALALSLKHLTDTNTPVEGFGDHLVSEAIYLSDPDGNGIEVYRDRPVGEWSYTLTGQVRMATEPLDVNGLLGELKNPAPEWAGLPSNTRLGHVHLQVSSIRTSEEFYCRVLGFDLMTRMGPSASFVSAGGYHHHIGLNTWAGRDAPPPPPDSIGLRYFGIHLPDSIELDALVERIQKAGIQYDATPEGYFVRDPSQNGILLTAAESP